MYVDSNSGLLYIGVRFLTLMDKMAPPDDRITKILEAIKTVKNQDPAPAKLWLNLWGLMGSAEN